MKALDIITIGRSSVDLYGSQIGGDDAEMWAAQEATVLRLFHAARRNRLELLLEVIPSKVGPVEEDTTARIIQRFYDLGVHPDWWKLEPFKTRAAWQAAVGAIEPNDPRTRGIVVLGLDAPEDELASSFALAAKFPLVKGFAGRPHDLRAGGARLARRPDRRRDGRHDDDTELRAALPP